MVRAHTAYGGDGSPHWGQAYQVVEDYGGIGRTTTTSGYTSWGTADDVTDAAGDPASPSRVFQTLNKLNSDGSMSAEEFDYAFDGAGRLLAAAFAQTPQSGLTYTAPALNRALALYTYDAGGRLTDLEHSWQQGYSSGAYSSTTALLGNQCDYEICPTNGGNYNRGFKTHSRFYSGGSLVRTELYGYDNNLDYLTSASYDGGSTYSNWSYDAAGNRNDASVCDNLNRATTISGVTRTYDILGNTQTIGSTKTLSWDVLNRMTQFQSGTNATNYLYRPDGMRIQKSTASNVYTTYGYDGQMPVEEFNYEFAYPSTQFIKVIRYGLGARGIDRIERVQADNTSLVGYPLYDAHGNMVATISKSGNSYSLGDQRGYDAWGVIRSGNTSGEPRGTHCANLGHVQDDESGLVYMRARYYDASSGRFLGEDPANVGWNWFAYCNNNPVNYMDRTGLSPVGSALFLLGLELGAVSLLASKLAECDPNQVRKKFWSWVCDVAGLLAFIVTAMGVSESISGVSKGATKILSIAAYAVLGICGVISALYAYINFKDWLELLNEEDALTPGLQDAHDKLVSGDGG